MNKLQKKKEENKSFVSFFKLQIWQLILILFYLGLYWPISYAYQIDASSPNIKYVGRFVFDTVPVNLEEIISSSDRIFSGICTEIKEIEKDPLAKLAVVKFTFKITEGIKGVNGKNEISFKQWKPTARDASYEIGKKYILFLHPNSKIGLTTPVGFLQGYFEINIDNTTKEEFVANKLGNRGLSRNLRTQKKISIQGDKELSDYIENSSENGNQIRCKEFIKTIKYFVNKNEI